MPNYKANIESISNQLIAIKERVQYFIDDNHWPEVGRYKEIILSEVLRNTLPQNVSIATGFVMCSNSQLTSQIDIIVYKNDFPSLFKLGDFVVVSSESVVGIIEVKSKITCSNIAEAIEKSHNNGVLISKDIFNGIFGFETDLILRDNRVSESVKNAFASKHGFINHICLEKDYFMKYWSEGYPNEDDNRPCFSTYHIENLSIGYFISNLIEEAFTQTHTSQINNIIRESIYPISEGKETYRLRDYDIKFELEE